MTGFLLIRHGDTDANGKYFAGRMTGVPLSARGVAQAEIAAKLLATEPIVAVYSSPLERTQSTARIVARPHGLDVVIRPGLTDVEVGAWTGVPFGELALGDEFQRFNAWRTLTQPPGGEHIVAVQARMVAELLRLRELHPEQQVAVVSHADPLRAVIAFFLGLPLDALLRFEVGVGSWSLLELGANFVQLRYLNRTG